MEDKRFCEACGADISDRPARTRFCLDCNCKRARESNAQSARRRAAARGRTKKKKPVAVVDCAIDVELLKKPEKLPADDLDAWVRAADRSGLTYGKYVTKMEAEREKLRREKKVAGKIPER